MFSNFLYYYFIFIGLGSFYGTILEYQKTTEFLASSVKVEAKVIDFAQKEPSDTSNAIKPVFEFKTTDGTKYKFEHFLSSSSYRIGDIEEIYYRKSDPNDAKASGFFSIYHQEFTFTILGIVFIIIGSSLLFFSSKDKRKKNRLIAIGFSITTKIKSIALNDSLTENGKKPFVIHSIGRNPYTSEEHEFKSENIWFDPSEFVKTETITVFMEKENPKNYWMDIRFLPKKPFEFSDLF